MSSLFVTRRLIRFSEFELDLTSGELRKRGSKIRLQEQLFQVLVVLLERANEVVTRDDLKKRLWPENTFVDFDRSLNKAINGLRRVLKDRAEKPQFIETIPKRGYRFIGQVEGNGRSLTDRPQIDSIAVLPLENLSGDPEQEFFADGMTEELICALARIGSIRVISRTSVMAFKGARGGLANIATQLRVDAIVEGTVMRSGPKVRITAQLIRAADDRHLWSGRYERDLSDVLQLQHEIAHSVAGQIQKMVEPGSMPAEPLRRVHPQAFEAYLKGNFFRVQMTPMALDQSVAFFNKAIELNPGYGPAYADLSQAYVFLGIFGAHDSREMFLKARKAAAKALELDETAAAAHNAMAMVHILHDWDWGAAEAECRRATELNPGASLPHVHLADYLSIRGRHEEAVATYARVLELDPVSRVQTGFFGLILHRARRYDESIAYCKRALEIDPNYTNALWFLALSLEQTGDLFGVVAALEKAVSLSHAPHHRALLARAYALVNDTQKATHILAELQNVANTSYVSAFDLAVVHHGLGDRESTFACLESAYQNRVFRIIELTFPMFDSLRTDVRWQNLVRGIGLLQ